MTWTETEVSREFARLLTEEESPPPWRGDLWFGDGWDSEEQELTGRTLHLAVFESEAEYDRSIVACLADAGRRHGSGVAVLLDREGKMLVVWQVNAKSPRIR